MSRLVYSLEKGQTAWIHRKLNEKKQETSRDRRSKKLLSGAGKVAAAYPEIWSAYPSLGKACSEAGPSLVKLPVS